MNKNHLATTIIFSAICSFLIGANSCLAQDAFSPLQITSPADNVQFKSEVPSELSPTSQQGVVSLTENDAFCDLVSATDKFVQCNIRASWNDFKALINDAPQNDFIYMTLANKMSDLGFFDLANLALSKIKDQDLAGVSTDAMKAYYYPRRKPKLEDELFLAEAYSNILYNNQSSEATNELLKNEELLSNCDYANYLVALGSYKSSMYSRAKTYINIALIQNPDNLNYQSLKAEILADSNEPGEAAEAIKIVESLKKENLYSYEYEKKIKSLEQFVLYKTKMQESEKDYHLGYYYHIGGDDAKAISSLQSALSSKRHANKALINSLMSCVYFDMNEFEKALDTAKKAYKLDRNNPSALLTLGNLAYRDKNYKQALEYYKKAATRDKKSYTALVKEAQAYQRLANVKKAKELYTKVLKTHSDSWEAYYNVALLQKDREAIYLKKALALNPLFDDGWIEIARTEIYKGNYDIAQKYLSNAYYIDENDFRYYYYQGLVNKNSGDYTKAENNFKKCLKLNSDFKDAQNELNSMDVEDKKPKQDNIL